MRGLHHHLVVLLLLLSAEQDELLVEAFSLSVVPAPLRTNSPTTRVLRLPHSALGMTPSSYNDEDDDDDGDLIDPDSLGDWRAFRRNLADVEQQEQAPSQTSRSSSSRRRRRRLWSKQNAELLESQNKDLAFEYVTGVWAHTTSTPEVGGLMVRMPLEAEIYRNYRHSMTGRKLRSKLKTTTTENADAALEPAVWYKKAQIFVQEKMLEIANQAGDDGQIDATTLNEESAELLQLYIENQETWQEVCLVLERDEDKGTAETIVLNRPMALKLTENLAQLVLYGASLQTTKMRQQQQLRRKADMIKFMLAFGQECAVYVGGPNEQVQPAVMIHGMADLPGAVEISPGARIYRGGLEAAIQGVLQGKYKPLDFRFFVGRHLYEKSSLDVSVVLGKYQPIACARSLALKQCISLPKPLWHEAMELCGGEMKDISRLELSKRDDLSFELVDDDDNDIDETGASTLLLDDDDDDDLPDELDELETLDDDEEDFYL